MIGTLLVSLRILLATSDSCKPGAEALQRREFALAETLIKQCLAAHPNEIFPYLQLCALYQLQGKNDELHRIAISGLKKFPDEKRFYLTIGNRAGQKKRFERAVEVFSEAHRRWPEDPKLRDNLAGSYAGLGMKLLDEGKNQEAAKNLRRAIELSEDDVEAHLNLGRALHNLNQSQEALKEFDRVLRLNEQLPLSHFHRGMVLYSLGEYERAIEDLNMEIQSNPDYPPSYLFRGQAKIAMGDWGGALPDLEMAARRLPENARAQFARARCLNQLGRTSEAEAGFRRTMDQDPNDPGPVNALGRLLWESGRQDEAEQMFRKAAELDKKIRSARPGEIRFEPLRPRRPQ